MTPKQLEALKNVVNMPNKVAASKMGITESTLEKHLAGARESLGCRHTAQAIARAIKQGLIKYSEIGVIAFMMMSSIGAQVDVERARRGGRRDDSYVVVMKTEVM